MKTDQNKQRTIKNNGCEEDMKNKTTSIIDIIIKEIDNLMEQATKEKSHYYVKSVLEKCKSVIKLQAKELERVNRQRTIEQGAWEEVKKYQDEIAKLRRQNSGLLDTITAMEMRERETIVILNKENKRLREIIKKGGYDEKE